MIDLNQEILQADGTPYRESKDGTKDGEKIPLTLSSVLITAIGTFTQDDEKLSRKERVRIGLMAEEIFKSDEIEFDVADLAMLQGRVDKVWKNNIIVARACVMLEDKKENEAS